VLLCYWVRFRRFAVTKPDIDGGPVAVLPAPAPVPRRRQPQRKKSAAGGRRLLRLTVLGGAGIQPLPVLPPMDLRPCSRAREHGRRAERVRTIVFDIDHLQPSKPLCVIAAASCTREFDNSNSLYEVPRWPGPPKLWPAVRGSVVAAFTVFRTHVTGQPQVVAALVRGAGVRFRAVAITMAWICATGGTAVAVQ